MPQAESPSPLWLRTYLDFLGLDREPPSRDSLRRLSRAHLSRVPFENITSILRRAAAAAGPVPKLDREAELEAWVARRGGGMCFEVVDMFGTLLAGLGFQAYPVLGTISFVGAHQAVLVEFDEARYLVDAGNGAPFFEPIPLHQPDREVEISYVGLRYRFRAARGRPDAWIQDRWIEGAWQPFCTYDLGPATDALRHEAYQRHHRIGQSWVVDNLTLVRCTDSEVWSLRDDRLTHYTSSGKSTGTLTSSEAYRRAAADLFDLPAAPIEQALEALRRRS